MSPGRSTGQIALALLVLLVAATGCQLPWRPPETPESQSRLRLGVRTAQVARGDITSLLVYPGELRAKTGATVVTRVPGRIEKLLVEPGMSVKEGDTVAELDRTAFEVQVVQAQAALAAAEARLATVKAGGDLDSQAEADASLRAAKARLAALETAPRMESIPTLAQAAREARRRVDELESGRSDAVTAAEARLTAARNQLDAALTTDPQAAPQPSPVPVTASAVVDQARLAVQQAQQEVARARQPISADDLAAARKQLADAEDALLLARWPVGPSDLDEARANVEAAEARLRRAGQPSSEAAVKAAQTGVEYAGAALELARLQLREATLTAPITGIIAETQQRQGSMVSAGTPVLSIQPPDYELAVGIDERQLAQVSPGQAVSVLVDVFPGESFTGSVRMISPSVDSRARTVAARVDVQDPRAKLKNGLSAQVAIAGARRTGTLIVPREAVLGTADAIVMAVVEGRARRQPVQIGVQDGRSVEIVQGLGEGAEVILSPTGILDGDIVSAGGSK